MVCHPRGQFCWFLIRGGHPPWFLTRMGTAWQGWAPGKSFPSSANTDSRWGPSAQLHAAALGDRPTAPSRSAQAGRGRGRGRGLVPRLPCPLQSALPGSQLLSPCRAFLFPLCAWEQMELGFRRALEPQPVFGTAYQPLSLRHAPLLNTCCPVLAGKIPISAVCLPLTPVHAVSVVVTGLVRVTAGGRRLFTGPLLWPGFAWLRQR